MERQTSTLAITIQYNEGEAENMYQVQWNLKEGAFKSALGGRKGSRDSFLQLWF